MSEGYWGLVWTFPGVLLWVLRMALELFWAFPAIWAVLSPSSWAFLFLASLSYGSFVLVGSREMKLPY